MHVLIAVSRVKTLAALEDGEKSAVVIRGKQFLDGLAECVDVTARVSLLEAELFRGRVGFCA